MYFCICATICMERGKHSAIWAVESCSSDSWPSLAVLLFINVRNSALVNKQILRVMLPGDSFGGVVKSQLKDRKSVSSRV